MSLGLAKNWVLAVLRTQADVLWDVDMLARNGHSHSNSVNTSANFHSTSCSSLLPVRSLDAPSDGNRLKDDGPSM